MIARVILLGYLAEKSLTYAESGTCILKLTVKTKSKLKDKKYLYHKVIFLDPTAERAIKYDELLESANSSLVYIEGRLEYRTTTEENGTKRKIPEIWAEKIKIIGNKSQNSEKEVLNSFEKTVDEFLENTEK